MVFYLTINAFIFRDDGNNSGMKKILVFILLVMFMVVNCVFLTGCFLSEDSPMDGILRIHIRASSNSSSDQEVKLVVRDSVIEFLSPYLKSAKDSTDAEKIVRKLSSKMKNMIDEVLYSCGFFYGCEINIGTEFFEKKSYGEFTLDSGYYRAIIVNLGTGEGRNWWCVAFPPLCFTLGEDYQNINYKSILWEIIKKERNNEQ